MRGACRDRVTHVMAGKNRGYDMPNNYENAMSKMYATEIIHQMDIWKCIGLLKMRKREVEGLGEGGRVCG